MGMTQSAAMQNSAKANIEYTIYTFQKDAAKPKSAESWQKQETLSDMAQAMKKAEALYGSGKYCKVEIKQKYTDPKNNRVIDTTLKTYARKEKKSLSVAALTGLAAFGGICAFLLTYFLGQN